MAAWQLERLQALLKHAAQHVAMYRESFDGCGAKPADLTSLDELGRFPILTKEMVRANFPDRMAAENRDREDWHYVGSGGTTKRVMVVHDFQRRDSGLATDLVGYTEDAPFQLGDCQVSIPPDECSVHCGLENRKRDSLLRQLVSMAAPRKWFDRQAHSDLRGVVMDSWIRRATVLPPLYMNDSRSVEDRSREALAEIGRLRPTMLVALPEYLRDLARVVNQDQARLPSIQVVRPMGSNLPAAWKPNIEAAFRCDLREHYGARETGGMAFDCRLRSGLHILTDQFIVEVECDGRPAAEDELGSILITDLNNFATPLIRYRIGDLGRVNYAECACGRTTPRLQLEGREQDAIGTTAKRVTSEAIANALYERYRVDQFQLVESSVGTLTLRMVRPSAMASDKQIIATIAQLIGESRSIRLRVVTSIGPEPSGKFRHCKAAHFADREAQLA